MINLFKKGILLSAFASTMVHAVVFNDVTLRSISPTEADSALSLLERHDSSVWLVQTYQDTNEDQSPYKMQIAEIGRQDGSLLLDNGRRATNNLTDLLHLSDGEIPIFAGGSVGPESGSWVLYNVDSCQSGTCDTLRAYRIFLDKNGYPKSIYGQLATQEIEKPKCDVDPMTSLTAGDEGIVRQLGCGETESYDYLFVKDEEYESSAKWEKSKQSLGIKTARDSEGNFAHLLFTSNESSVSFALKKQASNDSLLSTSEVMSANNLSMCKPVKMDASWGVVCLKTIDSKTSLVGFSVANDGTWNQEFDREHAEAVDSLTVGYNEKHIFAFERSGNSLSIINQNKSGGVFTSREMTSKDTVSEAVSSGQYVLVIDEFEDEWGNDRFRAVMFDALSTEQAPYFKKGISGTVPTLYELSTVVEVEDENTLPEDIVVEMTVKPLWINFDSETLEASGMPSNDEVGDWPVTLIATDGSGETAELESSLSVILTSAQVNIFEPTLFERLELEEPVPFYDLTQQLSPVQVLEDEVFEAKITVENREPGDVELVFTDLPDWLSYNPETMTLSGTPLQVDVGLSGVITALVLDKYNEDENRYPEIEMSIEVLEVDEAFEILSDGTTNLSVGENYYYQIEVNDEESSIDDFSITPGVLPNWLVFDADTASLSGTPSAQDEGRHMVQLVVQDEVGHTVVHSFEVVVSKAGNEKSGGSASLWGLLFLGLLGAARRK